MSNLNNSYNCSQYIYPHVTYETYQLEPYEKYINSNCLPISNNYENISQPYQNDNQRQNYSSNPIDVSTSFSNSRNYENNTLDKQCNCECHNRCFCHCCCCCMNLNMNSNVNELLDELTELRALYKQLMDDFNKAKNEKNAADSYIKELEKENGKIKNVNNLGNNNYNNINGEKLNKDFGRYAQMVHLSFDNILNPLSDLVNFNEGKLKGNVEYYLDNPLEYEKLLNEQKKFLESLKYNNPNLKNNIPYNDDIAMMGTGFDSNNNSLKRNQESNEQRENSPNLNMNNNKYPSRNNYYPNNQYSGNI